MPGIGSILGAYGNAYPQYQSQQINQLKLQQALQEMALQQQNRKAQAEALKSFSNMQGAGTGGVITPQQLAQASGGNPEAFNMLNTATRPVNTGLFNLAGRDITGQYGLERQDSRNQGEQTVAQTRGQSALDVANTRNQSATDVQKLRNEGSIDTQKLRNERPLSSRTTAAQNIANSPEYKTAKSEYEEAKKDERNIEAHYPMIGQAYNDPQWIDARKRSIAAQAKMESIQSKVDKQASLPAPQIPPEAAKQLQEGVVTTFGNGQKWTLTNGQPAQVE